MNKNVFLIAAALIVAVFASAGALAAIATVPLSIKYVEINGDEEYTTDNTEIPDKFSLGEEFDITVKVVATADVADAQIEAYISGYRYSQYERSLVSDVSKTFDLDNGTADTLDFNLQIPIKMDRTDDLLLRIRVSDKNHGSYEQVYKLNVEGTETENAIQIKEFTVSPSTSIEAGRPLTFKVKVKNYGEDDLDDVTATVSIPELGISDNEMIDEISAGESETFEELLIRVLPCTEPGTYTVKAVIEFDEYEDTMQEMQIKVLDDGTCESGAATPNTPTVPASKTVITVPESQDLAIGTTGAVYPVMISNLGSTAKTYTLTATGAESWGTVRFDPGAVVIVQPESVKTVYMYVAANENAQAGAQVFKLSVDGQGESKQVLLSANVKEGVAKSYDGLRRGLEIGLIVLVIVLIILGLIIGFNKLRGGKDDEEDSQTYY